jgi:serine/threonine protein kinase
MEQQPLVPPSTVSTADGLCLPEGVPPRQRAVPRQMEPEPEPEGTVEPGPELKLPAPPAITVSQVVEKHGDGPGTVLVTSAGSRYTFGEPLGHGSSGEVYACQDRAGTHYAIKCLVHAHGSSAEARQRQMKGIEREVEIMTGLLGVTAPPPRHIVRLQEVVRAAPTSARPGNSGGDGGTPTGSSPRYLVMERCSGSLDRLIAELGALHEGFARDLMQQLATGLRTCDEYGILHRDLKPQNLLFIGQLKSHKRWVFWGEPELVPPTSASGLLLKVGDFGLSRLVSGASSMTEGAGTAKYRAPEVTAGGNYDGKADLWSVGIILFELLTGAEHQRGMDLATHEQYDNATMSRSNQPPRHRCSPTHAVGQL